MHLPTRQATGHRRVSDRVLAVQEPALAQQAGASECSIRAWVSNQHASDNDPSARQSPNRPNRSAANATRALACSTAATAASRSSKLSIDAGNPSMTDIISLGSNTCSIRAMIRV